MRLIFSLYTFKIKMIAIIFLLDNQNKGMIKKKFDSESYI